MSQQINSNINNSIVKHFKKAVQEKNDSISNAVSEAMQNYVKKHRRTN